MKRTYDFPDEMNAELKIAAKEDGRSVNAQVLFYVRTMLGIRRGLAVRQAGQLRPWAEVAEQLGLEHHSVDNQPPDAQGIPPDSVKGKASTAQPQPKTGREIKPPCTCGPGERAKGKHNKKCPARE